MESLQNYVNVIEDETNNVTPTKYHEVILRSLLADGYLGDIRDVTINKYFTTKHHTLQPASEVFCDNIMLYKTFTDQEVIKENNQLLLSTNMRKITNYEIKECFIQSQRDSKAESKLELKPLDVKIKQIISAQTENTKSYILSRINKELKLEDFVGTFKVSLCDQNLIEIKDKLTKILENLAKKGYFLLDVDITQDFIGSFDENEVEQFLESNGINTQNLARTCISCILQNCRIKIYNKTACQFKSPGVTQTFGSNLFNYINCPQKRLKESFEKTIEQGLIRIEVTGGRLDESISMLQSFITFISGINIYYTPSYFQLRALLDEIKETVCILDREQERYYFCYYADSRAGKYIGYMSNKCKFTDSSYNLIISMFSIPFKPVIFIDILTKSPTQVHVRRFIKEGGETVITSATSMFSTLSEDISRFKLNLSGAEFTTLKKRYNVKSTPPFPIKEIGLNKKIDLKICSKRNLNKLEEKIIRENANRESDSIRTDLEQRRKELWEIDAFSEFLARNIPNENSTATTYNDKYLRSITGLENGTVFEVRGWGADFSTILTNLGTFRNEDKLAKRMQEQMRYFPHSLTVLFQTNLISTLSKPVFIIKKCRRDDFEILEQVSSDILDKTTQLYPTQFEINAALNKEYAPSKYMKLETLAENETYFIQTITKVFFRQKIRYLFRTGGNIYISNEFFEDAMTQIVGALEENHKHLHTLQRDLNKKVVVMKTYSPMHNSQRHRQLFVTLNFTELADNRAALHDKVKKK